jgi:amino acid adenylation domain-containing protein
MTQSLSLEFAEDERVESCPASRSQRRFWRLAQLEPHGSRYNIPLALHIAGPLDVSALEAAFTAVVARHEALRTTFGAIDDEVQQYVHPPGRVWIHRTVLRGHPEAPARLRELIEREAERPFDLRTGPLMRLTLVGVAHEEHVLLLTFHHIIMDRWSAAVLFDEVSRHYSRRDADIAARSSAPQYADYARDHDKWLRSGVRPQQIGYWETRLAGAQRLDLPTTKPRLAVRTTRGATSWFDVTRESMAAVLALARRRRATPFMVWATAFAILLHRYCGVNDIAIATPVAGRRRAAWERIIGLMMNTVVVRITVRETDTFETLLDTVRRSALEAYDNQDVPFEEVVRSTAQTSADDARFNVMLHHAPGAHLAIDGLVITPLHTAPKAAKFDLTWSLISDPDDALCVRGDVEYSTDLFDAADVQRMIGHFQVLLDAGCADAGAPVATLPMLTDAERQQVLVSWNRTAVPYPRHQLVHELFEQQATRTPDAPAVIHGGHVVRYAELARRSDGLAARLMSAGARPGTRVGVHLERSTDLVVAIMAAVKTGAAYVPIDVRYPPERIGYMLADSAPVAVVVPPGFARDGLGGYTGATIPIDPRDGDGAPGLRRLQSQSPDDPVYVIYTSGSTGRPKGAAVSHRSFVNLVTWYIDVVHLTPHNGVLVLSSIGFDLTQKNLFAPLVVGGCVHLATEGFDPDAFAEQIEQERIAVVNCTPSAFYPLIQRARPGSLRSLRDVLLGGEPLRANELEAWRARDPHARPRIYNYYGPTECTDGATCYEWKAERREDPVPIGRPIFNVRVYVLDPAMMPLPIGVPGEIYIGGDGVGLGYINGGHSNRFVPDPFDVGDGARLYKTGDIGRWRDDGVLEFIGRRDHQVKVRGFRVELGEIEAVLRELADVEQAVAIVREDPSADTRLVGYVVPRCTDVSDEQQRTWYGHLKRRLPGFMVPDSLVVMDALPLSANGKVDRQRLPPPSHSQRTAPFIAPRTDLEMRLCHILASTLKIERVGLGDGFLQLGGHSLLALQALTAIRRELGIEISLTAFVAAQNVSELADVVTARQTAPVPAVGSSAHSMPERPLSADEHERWVRARTDRDAPNIAAVVSFRGPLSPARLEQALNRAFRRHDAFRTSFPIGADGRPRRVIHPHIDVALAVTDLVELPRRRQAVIISREMRQIFSSPVDILDPPLHRLRLYRRASDEHLLFLCVTHFVCDGWSLDQLLRAVCDTYDETGRPAESSEPRITQWDEYCAWAEHTRSGEGRARSRRYWQRKLADLPDPLRFMGETRARQFSPAMRAVRGRVDADRTRALATLAAENGVFVFSAVTAAIARWIVDRTGARDFLLTTVYADRDDSRFHDTVGYLINHLILRLSVDPDASTAALLGRINAELLDAVEHRFLPRPALFGLLPPADPEYGSRVQLFHTHLRRQLGTRTLHDGIVVAETPFSVPLPSPYDFKFYSELRDGRLELMLMANAGCFDDKTTRQYLAEVIDGLHALPLRDRRD